MAPSTPGALRRSPSPEMPAADMDEGGRDDERDDRERDPVRRQDPERPADRVVADVDPCSEAEDRRREHAVPEEAREREEENDPELERRDQPMGRPCGSSATP